MAIDVQTAGAHEDDAELNTAINTTPLVDVMLVLLIIFLVTIPVIVKTIKVELPNARNVVTQTKPENIVLTIRQDESIYYNNAPVTYEDVHQRLADALRRAVASGTPLPEVHIRGDENVRFQAVGKAILACQQAGVLKVGFLTEPRNE